MNVRHDYGVRWQSEAATPLLGNTRVIQKRRGASLPAAVQSAFTLIELILVLSLLVIITSLVAPAMSSFIRGLALDSEARRLFALIHAGENRAVSEGMPVILWIDEKKSAYGLEAETSGQNGDPRAEHLTLDETLQIAVVNVAATTPPLFRNLPAIRFTADGTFDENSPQQLRLTDYAGVSRWLVQSRNRMGYEIRDTEK